MRPPPFFYLEFGGWIFGSRATLKTTIDTNPDKRKLVESTRQGDMLRSTPA